MSDATDVAIIGGGPVGAALAAALAGSGLDVALLEARAAEQRVSDPRPLALSYGSRLILERLGMWSNLGAPTAIARIHVSQQGGFGRVTLSAQEARLPALGYVIDYERLHEVLEAALPRDASRYLTGVKVVAIRDAGQHSVVEFTLAGIEKSLIARLVVVADGGAIESGSAIKTVDYQQSALTSRVCTERAHGNAAFERFTCAGPLALLPAGDGFALVWTAGHDHAQQLCELAPAEFLAQLQRHFGRRLGAFTTVGARAVFPLRLRCAVDIARAHMVLIGNAAQTLHPVAGQGFNLGLRDAWELAEEIRRCSRDAIGSASMLAAYGARRRLDRGGGVWFTDSLVRLFSNDIAPLKMVRGAGLALLSCLPPARDFVVRRMIFGARG
ncbi:MAG: FAD-dependent monooxygenase [Pseudomonadota bacterium]